MSSDKEQFPVNGEFCRRIISSFGKRGRCWIEDLPRVVRGLEAEWNLTLSPPFDDLSYSYVVPGVDSSARAVVLKVALPGLEFDSEIAALASYPEDVTVHMYRTDKARGAVLLEQLVPGLSLRDLGDDETATRIAAELMRAIAVQPQQSFPTVRDWFKTLFELDPPELSNLLPANLVLVAQQLGAALLSTMDEEVLLHGDLHHMNILSASRRPWIITDPKGVIGEPEFEVGAFLRNPLPEIGAEQDLCGVLDRRLSIFHQELGYDRQRMRDWALAQSVLAIAWMPEGNEIECEPIAKCARALFRL